MFLPKQKARVAYGQKESGNPACLKSVLVPNITSFTCRSATPLVVGRPGVEKSNGIPNCRVVALRALLSSVYAYSNSLILSHKLQKSVVRIIGRLASDWVAVDPRGCTVIYQQRVQVTGKALTSLGMMIYVVRSDLISKFIWRRAVTTVPSLGLLRLEFA